MCPRVTDIGVCVDTPLLPTKESRCHRMVPCDMFRVAFCPPRRIGSSTIVLLYKGGWVWSVCYLRTTTTGLKQGQGHRSARCRQLLHDERQSLDVHCQLSSVSGGLFFAIESSLFFSFSDARACPARFARVLGAWFPPTLDRGDRDSGRNRRARPVGAVG